MVPYSTRVSATHRHNALVLLHESIFAGAYPARLNDDATRLLDESPFEKVLLACLLAWSLQLAAWSLVGVDMALEKIGTQMLACVLEDLGRGGTFQSAAFATGPLN